MHEKKTFLFTADRSNLMAINEIIRNKESNMIHSLLIQRLLHLKPVAVRGRQLVKLVRAFRVRSTSDSNDHLVVLDHIRQKTYFRQPRTVHPSVISAEVKEFS